MELSELQPADASPGVEFLAILRSMFQQQKTDRISSEAIVGAFRAGEDGPWPDHLPMTKAQLARRFDPKDAESSERIKTHIS